MASINRIVLCNAVDVDWMQMAKSQPVALLQACAQALVGTKCAQVAGRDRRADSAKAIDHAALMGFRSGSMSYARFRVVGEGPAVVDEALLSRLAEHVVRPPSVGPPPEVQVGWCAGQHVFDETFDYETVGFESVACFAMRMDTNRVPAELRRAYRAMIEREQATGSSTGYLNRAEKLAARDEVDERCKRELAEGRHRSSTMVPIVWDLKRRLVLAPAFSDVKVSALSDLFSTTFDCRLELLSAGALAREIADRHGWLSSLADVRPTMFTPPPPRAERGAEDEAGDHGRPIVPWSHGPEPNDFLGNEWLIWLWYHCANSENCVQTPAGDAHYLIDRMLDMDCAWEATGKQMLRADGPTQLPEAKQALRFGKWPRKAGLVIASDQPGTAVGSSDASWSLTVQGDRCLLSGVRVPKPAERFKSPREETEHRLASMLSLDALIAALYESFLAERLDADRWRTGRRRIGDWIQASARGRSSAASKPHSHADNARNDEVHVPIIEVKAARAESIDEARALADNV